MKLQPVASLVVMAALVLFPTLAHADWHGGHYVHDRWGYHRTGYYHHYNTYPYGRVAVSLPHGFISLNFGGHPYYYSGGVFYERRVNNYVVVQAPAGVVVSTIPYGYQPVVLDGRTYYTYNGVYYTSVPGGYEVVQAPGTLVGSTTTTTVPSQPAAVDQGPQDSFVVNVPNAQGGYTAVTIRKSGTGYLGPQGEYYADFPKLEQLRVMYAK